MECMYRYIIIRYTGSETHTTQEVTHPITEVTHPIQEVRHLLVFEAVM